MSFGKWDFKPTPQFRNQKVVAAGENSKDDNRTTFCDRILTETFGEATEARPKSYHICR